LKIPFIDLSREYKYFQKEFKNLNQFLKKGEYVLGKELELFERDFSVFISQGKYYGVGVNSGTDALVLALKALKVKEGDEIITTSFSFISTALAILIVGARPVFVDIKDDFNISPEEIKKAFSKRTKGIIIVHLFGLPCDLDEIIEIKNKKGIFLIEDCCQSFGSKYKDSYCGTFSEISCFSFYPTKNLSCFGDGGLCLTNSAYLYNKLKELRNPDLKKEVIDEIGLNSRLDNLQAKILRIKLKKIRKLIKKRVAIAKNYNKNLFPLLVIPEGEKEKYHSYNIYTIRVKENIKLKEYLAKRGIETKIYYPYALPEQPIFKGNSKVLKIDNCLKIKKEVISLPCYPFLKKSEQAKVIESIKKFLLKG
jgi:dTDP-4-amino-4,6-dideoxygalactose transaminase